MHHSILWAIWEGYKARICVLAERADAARLDNDFATCKEMTLLALDNGARVKECVHSDDYLGNLIHLTSELYLWQHSNELRLHVCTRLVRFFLEIGADMEFRNQRGLTPLLLVVYLRPSSSFGCLEALLSQGADACAADIEGRNALHLILNRLVLDRIKPTHRRFLKRCHEPDPVKIELASFLREGCNPLAVDCRGHTPSFYAHHNDVAWVTWFRVLYEAGWEARAIGRLSTNPPIPVADIVANMCPKCRRTGSESPTRFEEMDDNAEEDVLLIDEGRLIAD